MASANGHAPRTRLWDLPASTWQRALVTLRRALSRRCPYCGGGSIFRGYLELRDICPTCGVRFEREEGYFLGAYALNLIVSEFLALGLALYLIFGTGLRDADLIWQMVVAVAMAVAFPLLFFPYSRTVWIAMDLTFHPPGIAPERQLRRRHLARSEEESGRGH